MIGQILQNFPTDLADCEGMQADLARIEKWAQIFEHPQELVQTLVENTIKNLPAVKADVSKMVTNFKSGAFYLAGKNIADILILELGKVPKKAFSLETCTPAQISQCNTACSSKTGQDR